MTDLLRAELVRFGTTRLVLWLSLGAVAGALLIVTSTMLTAGDAGMPSLETHEGIRNVMSGATAGSLVALILGIVSTAGEHRHGTATSTFLVTPDRARVVVAKLLSTALVSAVFAVGSSVLTLAIAWPWLASKDIGFSVTSSDVWVVVTGALVATTLYGAAGVGIGALVRNQTIAVSAAMVWVTLVEGLLIAVAPDVGRWLPGGASSALTSTTTAEGGLLPVWGGGLVFAAYAAVLAVAGVRVTARRDVL